ncbi:MAG: hypothetical protein ACM3QU_02180 [Verrucomicrobiota bacterium]
MSVVAVVAAGVLGVSGAGGAVGSTQARWVIRDLGTFGKKGDGSDGVAINERGQVVGSIKTDVTVTKGVAIGHTHAVLWQNGRRLHRTRGSARCQQERVNPNVNEALLWLALLTRAGMLLTAELIHRGLVPHDLLDEQLRLKAA